MVINFTGSTHSLIVSQGYRLREVEITIVHATKQAQSILAAPFSISGAGCLTALLKRGS
jgi:hypothetical protein